MARSMITMVDLGECVAAVITHACNISSTFDSFEKQLQYFTYCMEQGPPTLPKVTQELWTVPPCSSPEHAHLYQGVVLSPSKPNNVLESEGRLRKGFLLAVL